MFVARSVVRGAIVSPRGVSVLFRVAKSHFRVAKIPERAHTSLKYNAVQCFVSNSIVGDNYDVRCFKSKCKENSEMKSF